MGGPTLLYGVPMSKLLTRLVAVSLAFWLTSLLLGDAMEVTGEWWNYAWLAFLFGVVNATVGAVVRVLTIPATILTLGLSLWVINAGMLLLTDYLSDALTIRSFWWAMLASAIIAPISSAVGKAGEKAVNS